MDAFNPTDEVIQRAFALAFFILGDEAEALAVVREAFGKLEVAAAAQVKRLYYSPTRRTLWQRARPAGNRTKVSFSDTHLLQRLVYVESEPYERARELRADALRAEDLLVHYVKHLIRISIKRNSFYVALGVSRLLHSYSTSETMEIYNVVVQDPDRVKDDYYYRSRKGRLLQEVKERFEEFVSVCRGSRGEERFETLDAPGELAGLVAACLEQFSPWRTPCPIPERYDPTTDEIPTLSSAHQGAEDKIEINRIHAVVHPECYELLTGSLKLEPPASRLSVPRFNLPNGKNNMSSPNDKQRRHGPPLGGSEVAALKRLLAEQSARRKATHARLLSVVVDGAERARLDLWRASSVSLAVGDRDELVEVRALDPEGQTTLATHLLGGGSDAAKAEVVLEGGQRVTFSTAFGRAESSESRPASLSVTYRETEWPRAAALLWHRVWNRAAAPDGGEGRTAGAFAKPAFAALLLFVCAGALALYALRERSGQETARRPTAEQKPPVNQSADDVAALRAKEGTQNTGDASGTSNGSQSTTRNSVERGATETHSRSQATSASTPARGAATTHSAATAQGSRAETTRRVAVPEQARVESNRGKSETESVSGGMTTPRDADATRSVEPGSGAVALAKVRKVFIEVTGDSDLGARAARLLAGGLRAGGRLTPTDVKEEADAAFKLRVSGGKSAGAGGRPVTASARLVNEDGEVIWPAAGRGRAGVYTGTVEDVTRRIAGDLLKDVLRSDARQ
ncbi:MAG: hypothetical protein JOZ96_12030 [Acidobacteria bacterium]|nr:hypothetical protein [Acidobacteriota bacterium]